MIEVVEKQFLKVAHAAIESCRHDCTYCEATGNEPQFKHDELHQIYKDTSDDTVACHVCIGEGTIAPRVWDSPVQLAVAGCAAGMALAAVRQQDLWQAEQWLVGFIEFAMKLGQMAVDEEGIDPERRREMMEKFQDYVSDPDREEPN